MGAGVADQDSAQVYSGLLHAFVEAQDFVGQAGDVDASVALAGDVEVVAFVLRVEVEEHLQGFEVVLGHRGVVGGAVLGGRGREAHSAWTLEVDHIGLLVPGAGIGVHLCWVIFFEIEGSVFREEACE